MIKLSWLFDICICHVQHIHEYYRLISEKQQQYPNALYQRCTHTDVFFWIRDLQFQSSIYYPVLKYNIEIFDCDEFNRFF